jgi:hypothetical protein
MPERLPPQPPAQPPPLPAVEPPSLLVYAGLVIAGGVLISAGIAASNERWAGLWLNLATELIGAVIILIIVERRLRAAEVTVIGRRLLFVFSREARQLVSYATVLTDRITAISIRPYMDRGAVEEQILEESARGGVLVIGSGGAGKTTLLHQLALQTAAALIDRPRSAVIPVLLPMRFWSGENMERLVLRSVNRYARVSTRYLRNALRSGRLLCLLDGFDEVARQQDAIRAIDKLRRSYPSVRIVATTRGDAELPGFKSVEIPAMAI